MPTIKKISIALPAEMAAVVRQAVEVGEYSSNSEVIREALRDWNHKRALRQQEAEELHRMWQQALEDKRPGVPVDDVLDRLEKRYQAMIDGAADAP
jgi:antitoxin ParD1/3/4